MTTSPKFLTRQQASTLLESIDNPRHRLMVLLMLRAGLRVSEMLAIRLRHIDFKHRMLTVEKSLKKRGKVKSRQIPMADDLLEAMVHYCSSQRIEREQLLFTYRNKPISRAAVYNMLKRLERQVPEVANLQLYPHKLRHTFATHLRAEDAKLEDIRDLLGHEKVDTSLIYAHADKEKLRQMINRTEKKSWLKTLRRRFSRKRVLNLNYQQLDKDFLIGRKEEVMKIQSALEKGVNVIITGAYGVGKKQLLDNVCALRPTLVFDDTKQFKKSVLNAILFILDGNKEELKRLMFGDISKEQLTNRLSKESLISCCDILMAVTQKGEYVLQISDMDGVTPTVVKALEKLNRHFVIITAARSVSLKNSTFLWNFERIELKPLSRADSLKMIYRLSAGIKFEDYTYARNAIYEASQGNPRMMVDLCERLAKEPELTREVVAEIVQNYVGRELQQIDMSIYFLLLFGGLAVLRYLAAEVGDTSLRFIGGCFMIFMLFARYFFNSFKRSSF
ncbi:tyrosine-type recombinase/integrase [Limibacter armeniacum]|uniref:tyrosine-type recombinase/integrase n=1 Tax=Limibacter armeniacum TaxID=466084 RepID=UPI002FE60DEA